MRLDDEFGHNIPPPTTAYGAEYSYNKQWGQQDRFRSKYKYHIFMLNKFGQKLYRAGVLLKNIEKFLAVVICRILYFFCDSHYFLRFFQVSGCRIQDFPVGITAVLVMISCKNSNGATSRDGGVGNPT
jgi:hypothetical protein